MVGSIIQVLGCGGVSCLDSSSSNSSQPKEQAFPFLTQLAKKLAVLGYNLVTTAAAAAVSSLAFL